MKRVALAFLLVPLALIEIYLCTAFLPAKWQLTINDRMADILPRSHDWTPVTHPMMSDEVGGFINEHVGVQIALFTVTVALMIGNAWIIRRVWQHFRGQKSSEGS